MQTAMHVGVSGKGYPRRYRGARKERRACRSETSVRLHLPLDQPGPSRGACQGGKPHTKQPKKVSRWIDKTYFCSHGKCTHAIPQVPIGHCSALQFPWVAGWIDAWREGVGGLMESTGRNFTTTPPTHPPPSASQSVIPPRSRISERPRTPLPTPSSTSPQPNSASQQSHPPPSRLPSQKNLGTARPPRRYPVKVSERVSERSGTQAHSIHPDYLPPPPPLPPPQHTA